MSAFPRTAMFDPATGDLWLAEEGEGVPSHSTHFDTSVEAERWALENGYRFTDAGFHDPLPFPKHLSDKIQRIRGGAR